MSSLLPLLLLLPGVDPASELGQGPNTWVKRSPLAGGPPSPSLGYEGSLVWDAKNRRAIRFAGHNQGGGGEQNAETWSFDPITAKWELKEPNTSPPGACCNQQNVFDLHQNRFLRFPAFSGSHGWQWFREIYLSNSTVWNYDLGTNTWRDRRPAPAPRVSPLRCASWDSDHQVVVIFGGEGNSEGTQVYDPFSNMWHRMNPQTQPEPRSGGNMAYDAVAKRHILFGTQFGEDRHTWAYDLRKNEWTDLKPKSQPPTDRNDPVLAWDANLRKVIAVVRAVDRDEKTEVQAGHLETWAYDFASKTWSEMKPNREPDGWGNRRRVMVAMPELNAMLLEAYVNPTDKAKGVDREQQMWTYRATPGTSVPAAPANLTANGHQSDGGVSLAWDPVPGATGYAVHRGLGDHLWTAEFKLAAKIGADRPAWLDTESPKGRATHYRVSAILKDGSESALGPIVQSRPRIVEDVRVTVRSAKDVRIDWNSREADVTGYHVERAPVEVFSEDQLVRLKKDTPPLEQPSVGAVAKIGRFQRITREPVRHHSGGGFTDDTIDLEKQQKVEGEAVFTHRFSKEQIDADGKPYRFAVFAYRVVAVNIRGDESGPSAWMLTIPPAPQHVFASEDGASCRLKWGMPRDRDTRYRVYRMEGPKVNGPGQKVARLTEKPIESRSFTDGAATKETKRYWVVEVDALGQEGIPSAPAWHWRQFRDYYKPFTGEWHQ